MDLPAQEARSSTSSAKGSDSDSDSDSDSGLKSRSNHTRADTSHVESPEHAAANRPSLQPLGTERLRNRNHAAHAGTSRLECPANTPPIKPLGTDGLRQQMHTLPSYANSASTAHSILHIEPVNTVEPKDDRVVEPIRNGANEDEPIRNGANEHEPIRNGANEDSVMLEPGQGALESDVIRTEEDRDTQALARKRHGDATVRSTVMQASVERRGVLEEDGVRIVGGRRATSDKGVPSKHAVSQEEDNKVRADRGNSSRNGECEGDKSVLSKHGRNHAADYQENDQAHDNKVEAHCESASRSGELKACRDEDNKDAHETEFQSVAGGASDGYADGGVVEGDNHDYSGMFDARIV